MAHMPDVGILGEGRVHRDLGDLQGLRILLDRWGLREQDVAAFGDSPNDLEMLAAAGRSVAMANADPAVKATARLETESNDDDGVLNQLERWFTEA